MAEQETELLDYEEEEDAVEAGAGEVAAADGEGAPAKKDVKGTYVSVHSSGFRDFLLKPEILKAIIDCGFEHPSEVQHECIPQAVLGMDILRQAKSGMGKTAVFVLATLPPTSYQISLTSYILLMIVLYTRKLKIYMTL